MRQFIDQVRITIASGDGGNGMVAWRREKYEPMGGPAGGNGGRGGNVYLLATSDLNTLLDFRFKSDFSAPPGDKGGPKGRHGRGGQDLIIKVPVGTVVRDLEIDQVVADLVEDGQKVLLAEGGKGGRGNAQMASPTRRAPYFCEPGQPGIKRQLELELKLLADVVLVGMPNAGKSSLLSIMTAARPKIADYPFSTLEPQLGVVKKPEGGGYVMADIPGLIEGASQGVGLGHDFLRHIERTRLIVHLADISSENLLEDLRTINTELRLYNERLSQLPRILVLNKIDLADEQDRLQAIGKVNESLAEFLPNPDGINQPLTISCATRQGVDELGLLLLQRLDELAREAKLVAELPPDTRAYEHPGHEFSISRHRNIFTIDSDRINRLVAVTDLRSPESLHHLHHVLRSMGVMEELIRQGIQVGHEVVMAGVTFTFGEDMM